MSENEGKPKEPESVGINVTLLVSERDHALELVKELTTKVEFLEQERDALQAHIDADSKAALINEIAPMTSVPTAQLALKTLDELQTYKKVLMNAKLPAFKSGTPITSVDKTPQAQLNSAFDDYMKKIGVKK